MTTVRFTGWNPGFNKIGMNAALREDGGLGLAEAKQLVDAILENRPAELTLAKPAASKLATRATECGVNVTVDDTGPYLALIAIARETPDLGCPHSDLESGLLRPVRLIVGAFDGEGFLVADIS